MAKGPHVRRHAHRGSDANVQQPGPRRRLPGRLHVKGDLLDAFPSENALRSSDIWLVGRYNGYNAIHLIP